MAVTAASNTAAVNLSIHHKAITVSIQVDFKGAYRQDYRRESNPGGFSIAISFMRGSEDSEGY